jgi:hypothetical protein
MKTNEILTLFALCGICFSASIGAALNLPWLYFTGIGILIVGAIKNGGKSPRSNDTKTGH